MNSDDFFEEVMELNRYFVKWGFAAYLLGSLLSMVLFVPALAISMFWELCENLQESYNEKKRTLAKETK